MSTKPINTYAHTLVPTIQRTNFLLRAYIFNPKTMLKPSFFAKCGIHRWLPSEVRVGMSRVSYARKLYWSQIVKKQVYFRIRFWVWKSMSQFKALSLQS